GARLAQFQEGQGHAHLVDDERALVDQLVQAARQPERRDGAALGGLLQRGTGLRQALTTQLAEAFAARLQRRLVTGAGLWQRFLQRRQRQRRGAGDGQIGREAAYRVVGEEGVGGDVDELGVG